MNAAAAAGERNGALIFQLEYGLEPLQSPRRADLPLSFILRYVAPEYTGKAVCLYTTVQRIGA
jgi:hypothetical protein